MIILYCAINSGLASIVLPAILFVYFLIIEGSPDKLIWNISFVYMSIVILTKFILLLDGLHILDENISTVFYQGNSSILYEGLLLGAIII